MKILVLCPAGNKMFAPIAKACQESFISLGHTADLGSQYVGGYDMAFFTVFHHPWGFSVAKPWRIAKDSTIKVGYHMEQLPWSRRGKTRLGSWLKRFKRQAPEYNYVIDTSLNNVMWLHEHGFPKVLWCALGYHPSLEMPTEQKIIYPVGFVGTLGKASSRRRKVVRAIDSLLLSQRNMQVKIIDNVFSVEDWTAHIYNIGIHLNIHAFSQGSWESYRTLRLMANKQFIITESIDDNHPFSNGTHWVEANWHNMPHMVMKYLDDASGRQAIAYEAYEFIKEKYNLTVHLGRVLHEIQSDRKKRRV